MKKILTGLLLTAPVLAFAQTGTTTATTTTVIATSTATSTQVQCISNSLDKRENALIAGHDTFSAAIKAALQKRSASLKDAWSQTDKKVRQTKKNEAWKAFRTESQAAHSAMRTVRNSAWKTFDTDMKACGVKGHGESPSWVSSPNTAL